MIRRRLDGFDGAILGATSQLQSVTKSGDCLMMERVTGIDSDRTYGPGGSGTFGQVDRMIGAPMGIGTKVLNQRSAVGNIDHLQSATNGQQRYFFGECVASDGDFDLVVREVDAVQLRCRRLLPVANRIDVATTVQNDSVATRQQSLEAIVEVDYWRNDDRNSTRASNGVGVGATDAKGFAAYARGFGNFATNDQNNRISHRSILPAARAVKIEP